MDMDRMSTQREAEPTYWHRIQMALWLARIKICKSMQGLSRVAVGMGQEAQENIVVGVRDLEPVRIVIVKDQT